MINYFRYSKCARDGRVALEEPGFSWITALVLTYFWIKCYGAVLSVTDLPRIQTWHQPFAGEN